MKMTSAYANKMLRQLNEDKNYWTDLEEKSCLYTAAVGEEPVIPEYDYMNVANTITEIDSKIAVIKHAINLHNVNSLILVGDEEMSVDTVLVKMAQLTKRKTFLDFLRKHQPQTRMNSYSYSSRNTAPEYQYINYDLELIKKEFEKVSESILQMQMALDIYNQTSEFEVDI